MIALDELKVARELRPVVEEIVGITDSVCLSLLDEEYADLARRAVAKLAQAALAAAGRPPRDVGGWGGVCAGTCQLPVRPGEPAVRDR